MIPYRYPPEVSFMDKLYGLIYKDNAIKVMQHQFLKLGDSYSIDSKLSPYRFIFTRDADLTDYFLRKNHRNYEKSIFQTEILGRYLGKGLLTNKGDDWKRQRRLIQPGFNHQRLEALNTIMMKEIESFLHQIPENETLDFYPLMNKMAFHVVAKSLFSTHINQEEINFIGKTITESQELFIKETRNPLFRYYLRYSGTVQRHLKQVKKSRNLFQLIIEDRKKSTEEHNDLLDLMLHVRYENTGEPMEMEQLIDELMILFIAGHETTANALSFTLYLLGKHPWAQQAIQKEIDDYGSDYLKIENLFKPGIIQRVLKESLRLFPPAWIIDRQALSEDGFGEFSWAKDTILISNIYEMNHNPRFWEAPDSFQPDRFLDETIKKSIYIPFGSGPRYCIGEHFADMEMQLFLRMFCKDFIFEGGENSLKLKTYVTLRPETMKGKKIPR